MSGNIIPDPQEGIRFRMEIHDNWYSVRVAHSGRVLMVGTWLPPEGIAGLQVDRLAPDEARDLLEELRMRSEGPSLVGTIEGRG